MLLIDAVICMWCIDDKTSVMGGGVRMMWGVCCVFVIIIIIIFARKKRKKKHTGDNMVYGAKCGVCKYWRMLV